MRKLSLILALTLVALLATASLAFANHTTGFDLDPEVNIQWNANAVAGQGEVAPRNTYNAQASAGGCNACHGFKELGKTSRPTSTGPHGGYSATTGKCMTCHVIHKNAYGNTVKVAQNSKLLPGETITGVCNYCHDLTGTPNAPYSTRYLGVGGVKSGHYVEGATEGDGINAIMSANYLAGVPQNAYSELNLPGMEFSLGNAIPGGNAGTGGALNIDANTFAQGDFAVTIGGTYEFTCDSCHSPHGIARNVVATYQGESERVEAATNRLLKIRVLGSQSAIPAAPAPIPADLATTYGSKWCAGCHQGRLSMDGAAGLNNHPVNTDGPGYLNKAWATAEGVDLSHVVNGAREDEDKNTGDEGTFDVTNDWDLSHTNAWYAMSDKDINATIDRDDPANEDAYGNRTDGYIPLSVFDSSTGLGGPSCQQCHASPRDVESSQQDRVKFFDDTDGAGRVYTGQPFTTFPHVSRNASLLVEAGDDLCTNCHTTALP